jgi:hypothetical protein
MYDGIFVRLGYFTVASSCKSWQKNGDEKTADEQTGNITKCSLDTPS